MSHQHLSHQSFFSPPLSLNLSRPHLRQLPSIDLDEHRQRLKVGWVACVVLVQLLNFLIGTLVLVLAEISGFFFSPSTCSSQAPLNVSSVHFSQHCLLSLSIFSSHPLFPSLSFFLCPSLSPSPPSLSPGDHTQRFLFPVGVMSLLHKQSALICQRSSRRFIKIQQAPTKDVCVPAPLPLLPLCSKLQLFAPCSFC